MLVNPGRGRTFLAIFGVLSLLLASIAGITSTTRSTRAAEDALVLGVDISDTRTLDPHRQFDYSPPITEHAIYETLVTMDPGDYTTVKPLLATEWELADDGGAWVFHLRPDVKFVSGNPMTADDVKFSFDRLVNLKDNPAALAENLKSVEVVDEQTVKLVMNDKTQPLLNILISPNFAVIDAKTAQEHGATSAVGADTNDTATEWLNAHSIGTGPYELSAWDRNSQIVLTANPNYWRAAPAFPRVVIRHIGDGAAQVLARPARRHRCRAQPVAGAARQRLIGPQYRVEKGTEPRLHVHDPHQQRRPVAGALEQGRPAGGRRRNRLRRDHQGTDGRQRHPAADLHPCRPGRASPRRSRRRSAISRTWPRPRSSSPTPGCRTASRSISRTPTRRSPASTIRRSPRRSSPTSPGRHHGGSQPTDQTSWSRRTRRGTPIGAHLLEP